MVVVRPVSIPMPLHERFYPGTVWVIAAGPVSWMGVRVIVVGEIYTKDDDLWVPVISRKTSAPLEACLSWLS